eukprot:COSAG02_NODE_48064_length_336_cov_1.080169_1_plen_96_part_00
MSQFVSSVVQLCLCLSQVIETGVANADLGHLVAWFVLVKIHHHVQLRLNFYLSPSWTFSTLLMAVECVVWMNYVVPGNPSCQSSEAAEVVICSWC